MKKKLSLEEHLFLGTIMNMLERLTQRLYIYVANRFSQNSKIVMYAEKMTNEVDRFRSSLDDDICSFKDPIGVDPVKVYYGKLDLEKSLKNIKDFMS